MNKLVYLFLVILVVECLSAPQDAAPQKSAENKDDIIQERLSQPNSTEKESQLKSSENADTTSVRMGGSDAENGEDKAATKDEELMFGGDTNGSPITSAQSMVTNMRTFLQAIRSLDQLLGMFGRFTGISSS